MPVGQDRITPPPKIVDEAPCPVLVLTRGEQHDDQVAEAASGAAHAS
jgi:hypothetical protein